jgi:Lon protease-like protein
VNHAAVSDDVLADLPIFPLGTVLFPGGMLPLRVFETRYMDMTRECMRAGTPFGVCLIRQGAEVGAPAVPEPIGTLAHIVDWDMRELGVLALRVAGGDRFRIRDQHTTRQGLVRAAVERVAAEEDAALEPRYAGCVRLLQLVVLDQPAGTFAEPHRFESASWVGYRLCEVLPLPLAARQRLLELGDSVSRLEILRRFLEQRGLASGA